MNDSSINKEKIFHLKIMSGELRLTDLFLGSSTPPGSVNLWGSGSASRKASRKE